MADTQRTLAELQALLADNSVGAISAQDVRDLLKSLTPPYGSFNLSAEVETTINAINTPVKTAGTTAAVNVRDFNHGNGRLTYDGTVDNHFHVASTISFIAAGNNKLIAFYLAKNGTVITGSRTPRKVGTGADVGSLAVHWDVMLSPGDYLEVWVANETDSTNITAQALYLFAMGMIV